MEKTLSDFYQMEILRGDDGIAEIIFDYIEYEGENKPVRLIGFFIDAEKTDIEIREEAYFYYLELKDEILKIKYTD